MGITLEQKMNANNFVKEEQGICGRIQLVGIVVWVVEWAGIVVWVVECIVVWAGIVAGINSELFFVII